MRIVNKMMDELGLADIDGLKNVHLVSSFINSFHLLEPIVEIGSYQVVGRERSIDIRPLLINKTYIGCDMREGPGVDRVENVEKLTFVDNSIGTIISLNTFEHVQNCHKAAEEIYRVLKPGGATLITSVLDFNIHDHPSDYWRFTPEGFRYLMRKFENVFIGYDGDPIKPRIIFAIGIKGEIENGETVASIIERKYKKQNKNFIYHLQMFLIPIRTLFRLLIRHSPKIKINYYKNENI